MFMKFIPPPNKFGKGLIVGFLSAAILFSSIPVTAAVSDNSDGFVAKLASFLGFGKESSTPSDSEFDSASLVEKVNYLEDKTDRLEEQINNNTLTMNAAKTEILQAVSNVEHTASSAYKLYCYINKGNALASYVGTTLTLRSSAGQTSSAVMKDDGSKYSCTIYFDFSGSCKLSYNAPNNTGQTYSVTENVTISNVSTEFNVGSQVKKYTFYVPASVAIGDYSGVGVTACGRYGTLAKIGDKYQTTILSTSNYYGDQNISFTCKGGAAGDKYLSVTRYISTNTGTNLIGANMRNDLPFVHEVCARSLGTTYFSAGSILMDNYFIVRCSSDNLFIWNIEQESMGLMDHYTAITKAKTYYSTFNTKYNTSVGYASDLITSDDVMFMRCKYGTEEQVYANCTWLMDVTQDGYGVTLGYMSGLSTGISYRNHAQACVPGIYIH